VLTISHERGCIMSDTIRLDDVETLIRLSISEDISGGDITSQAIFKPEAASRAAIVSKQQGVFCGSDMVRYVYEMIDPRVSVSPKVHDGDTIGKKETLMTISGPTVSVLSGERIALNFIQRMSGIATRTSHVVSLLKNTNIKLLDTRKTLPGFRALDKYAVKTGGGTNHRMGLYDMVMIKDNHIRAAGGIARAVTMVRERYGSRYLIEVETANQDEVREAVAAGADIIMLDNMDTPAMKAAVELIHKRAKIEVSGNMDEERIKGIRELDVDYVSMGALTHSVTAFDCSMEFDA
jgi:nicotinate-nucleotide pyrophosphorylase (carboxylating)